MERFLEQSIRGFQSVIETLTYATQPACEWVSTKPAALIVLWLTILVGANLSSDWRLFVLLMGVVAFWGTLVRLPIRRTFTASVWATVLFSVAMGLLYVLFGSSTLTLSQRVHWAWFVSLRSLFSVFLTLTLVQVLGWRGFTRGLRSMGLPSLFALTIEMTVRYLYLLSENALNMMLSRKSRVFSVNPPGSRQFVGASAAFLWLKSSEMSEQVYQAMVSRGYDPEGEA